MMIFYFRLNQLNLSLDIFSDILWATNSVVCLFPTPLPSCGSIPEKGDTHIQRFSNSGVFQVLHQVDLLSTALYVFDIQ